MGTLLAPRRHGRVRRDDRLHPAVARGAGARACLRRGRESACIDLATEVQVAAGAPGARRLRFVAARASLARLLARLLDVPAPSETTMGPVSGVRYHSGDLCTRF